MLNSAIFNATGHPIFRSITPQFILVWKIHKWKNFNSFLWTPIQLLISFSFVSIQIFAAEMIKLHGKDCSFLDLISILLWNNILSSSVSYVVPLTKEQFSQKNNKWTNKEKNRFQNYKTFSKFQITIYFITYLPNKVKIIMFYVAFCIFTSK